MGGFSPPPRPASRGTPPPVEEGTGGGGEKTKQQTNNSDPVSEVYTSPLMSQVFLNTLAPVLKKIEDTHVPVRREKIIAAYEAAKQFYEGQMHWSGLTLLEHCLEVLDALLPFEPDEDTIVACLLHHTLKTRAISLPELEERFGANVRMLISGVHLLSHVTMENRRNSIEDLRLMLLSVSDDARIVLVILCDRCAVLKHIQDLPLDERRRIAQDILNLFAPVAARLGIHSLKQRLERDAFPIVYPADAERIAEQLEQFHARHGRFLDMAAKELEQALAEQKIKASVKGREKHPYSIFMKMKAKSLTHIDRIHDLFALRVVVSSVDECYQTLGVLHRMGRPVTNRFKDFIAFPKPNGYQSLHTTLVRLPGVPESLFTEVQVRTESMDREAEFGIAAHWSYKEGGSAEQAANRVQLHNVLAAQHSVEGEESTSSVLADHIFVLTPKGDIVELPEGATPLDFAFQIHTDLGLAFKAARVNGSIVSLDHELENGDVVEIMRHRTPKPSPEWMQLVKMASSRTRLKRYLYSLHRDTYMARGRDLINAELKKRRLSPLDADYSLLRVVDGKILTFADREDVLMKIGQGSEKAASLLPRLLLVKSQTVIAPEKKRVRLQRKDSIVEMPGGVQMPMRFAGCCKPQAAEHKPIVGYITRSGVTIHLVACRFMKNANADRSVSVKWRVE